MRSKASVCVQSTMPSVSSHAIGGHLNTLTNQEKHEINDGVLQILSELGFEQLPNFLECFVDNKTIIKKHNRYCFGLELIERCLASINNELILHFQNLEDYLSLLNRNVYCGTGGTAPLVLDYEKKIYRPSLKKDLLSAARIVDKLENLSFFPDSSAQRCCGPTSHGYVRRRNIFICYPKTCYDVCCKP